MRIVKIGDALRGQARRASRVMCRSIDAQAEYRMNIGMLAEASPGLAFTQIVAAEMAAVADPAPARAAA